MCEFAKKIETVASITFQNFFRMYSKLAGMTGTADTEAFEFQQIYGLEVVVIPTHRPMVRKDHSDFVYLRQKDKFEAIIEDIRDCVARGQPVLVGTTSIETSEYLSPLLTKQKVAHQVLNAKQHEREAAVVAQAGRPGTVTIATNMAGRERVLCWAATWKPESSSGRPIDDASAYERSKEEWKARHEAVIAAGGLHIVGTERHESRRIDNQLRGRRGVKAIPVRAGSIFRSKRLDAHFRRPRRTKRLLANRRHEEGEVIESRMLSQADRRRSESRGTQLRRP